MSAGVFASRYHLLAERVRCTRICQRSRSCHPVGTNLEPARQVKAIAYCRDSYRVTAGDGKTRAFWERNLRFMTDSSQDGRGKRAPAIMPAGMIGDRAAVIFAAPDEVAKMIEPRC